MTRKKILITGANGFVGRNIAKVLKDSGFYLVGISRRDAAATLEHFDEVFQGRLGEPLEQVYETHKIHGIIHCAYDKNDTENIVNTRGTRLWAEQAAKHNVNLQVFISSISARPGAISPYGKSKFELEQWFIQNNHICFRLGLVIGDGGLFKTLVGLLKKFPVFPLIDRGNTLTYLSDVETIGKIVRDVVTQNSNAHRGRVWNLYQPEPYKFKVILKAIKSRFKTFCLLIPVPYFMLAMPLWVIEKIKWIKIGINRSNLLGIRQNTNPEMKSDLETFGYTAIPLDTLVKKL
jgi:nucleoside-diphosphate-sugar epimerase